MIVVVDASVATMWYLPQVYSEQAIGLLGSGHDLVAPDLVRVEVGNALLRGLRRKELNPEETMKAIRSLLPEAVRLLPTLAEQVEASLEIAVEHGGSVYDAIYIALARTLDAPIATNDMEMAATARKAGVQASPIADGVPALPQPGA